MILPSGPPANQLFHVPPTLLCGQQTYCIAQATYIHFTPTDDSTEGQRHRPLSSACVNMSVHITRVYDKQL